MDAWVGWAIFVALVVGYTAVVVVLYRRGRIGPDRALSLFGPALMIKTQRGKGFLERIGRFQRFWSWVGDAGVILAGAAMVTILAVLALDATVALREPASAAPTAQEALGIPGINPFIPIGYGLVALIIGVVLHEMMHGVIARSQKIGVKSIGVLWLVIPVGAFVEQDDVEMNAAPRRKRARVAAAGVLANLVLAVIFFTVLAAVVSVSVQPTANGVGLVQVVSGTPAAALGLHPGDVIVSINGTPTTTTNDLLNVLGATHANQTVAIQYYDPNLGTTVSSSVKLEALSDYTHVASDSGKGFLGVSPGFLTPAQMKTVLANPTAAPGGPLLGATYWVVLPIAGLEPIAGTTSSFYTIHGPLAGLGSGGFWVLANILYWLSWMNLLLGMSNALPLVPLDGGLIFRDFVASAASRLRKGWDATKLDAFAGRAAIASSLAVVLLLLWQFVAPHL
ncbi:MAG: site-2 protease family protein [Thermoplasmata archaeon]|nr:site-2 protease family protein [Thermoplasmata archaeon]